MKSGLKLSLYFSFSLLFASAYAEEGPAEALDGPEGKRRGHPRLQMVGVALTPHRMGEGLQYHPRPESPLGARIQVFVKNTAEDSSAVATMNSVSFDKRYPLHHLLDGSWAWHDTPNLWGGHGRSLPGGALSVWTINAVEPTWGDKEEIVSIVTDWGLPAVWLLKIPVKKQDAWISAVTFLGEGVRPDRIVIHVFNRGEEPIQIRYGPTCGLGENVLISPAGGSMDTPRMGKAFSFTNRSSRP